MDIDPQDQPLLNLLALAGIDPDTLNLYADSFTIQFAESKDPGDRALVIYAAPNGLWNVSTGALGDQWDLPFEEAVAFLRRWVNA